MTRTFQNRPPGLQEALDDFYAHVERLLDPAIGDGSSLKGCVVFRGDTSSCELIVDGKIIADFALYPEGKNVASRTSD